MTDRPDARSALPGRLASIVRWGIRRSNVVMFVAGFLFDALTIQRIDAWTDLALQLVYLVCLSALLLLQHRESTGHWTPRGIVARWWHYNVELLHFFYGGLLSAYVVLYFRSSSGLRTLVFFTLLVALMFFNEMPQVRRAGHRLRLGLYAFCVLSFLNYFVPIVVGRMNGWVFLAALLLSAGLVWMVADRLVAFDFDRPVARLRAFLPAAAVCAIIGLLYTMKLVPPVPLSVQFQGIYHDVQRRDGAYTLVYEKPPLWSFWRRDSRPFHRRPGDHLFYFVRVFAPAAFTHRIFARWEVRDGGGVWRTSDRIPVSMIRGGRAEGYRTFAEKSNFMSGRWRVTAETEDGRALATLTFTVDDDRSEEQREWATIGS
ncbi:MAG TPA: DUF2914 domain-containing protein [Vicinamibacterales bacterium]|nr:DUF2914 domain-containing protein [Vicinamibacterales bacterium]